MGVDRHEDIEMGRTNDLKHFLFFIIINEGN